jgi:hypothetical protein
MCIEKLVETRSMNMKNPAYLKISLLAKGMGITNVAKEGIGEKWQEKIYSYSLTDKVDRKTILPSDIKVENVFVGFRYNKDSEWEIEANKDLRVLTRYRKPVTEIKFIPRPSYYNMATSCGIPLKAIGVSCGNHGVSFFVNSYCEYFLRGENCKFCGLVPTQKKFSDTVKLKEVWQIGECLNTILDLGDQVDFIQLSGGSKYDHDAESRQYISFIKTVREVLDSRKFTGKIPIHLTCMPPFELDVLEELKDNGLETISFNLECTTPAFFEKYCPGKASTQGYEGIRRALRRARKTFGYGNVYTIVIAGLEPSEIFVRGLDDVMSDGIIPTINLFHKDPFCAPDMDADDPNPVELIDIACHAAELFRKYGAEPGKLGCAHYDIGHEIKKGYFNA